MLGSSWLTERLSASERGHCFLELINNLPAMDTVSPMLFRRIIKRSTNRKMAVVWVVAPCSLIEMYWRQRCLLPLKLRGWAQHRPDDGHRKYVSNACKILPDYTAQQPKRSPYLPPEEPEALMIHELIVIPEIRQVGTYLAATTVSISFHRSRKRNTWSSGRALRAITPHKVERGPTSHPPETTIGQFCSLGERLEREMNFTGATTPCSSGREAEAV
jgi:hypothetical protein